jgi:hypothetical protein
VKRGGVMRAPAVGAVEGVERGDLRAAQRVAQVLIQVQVVDSVDRCDRFAPH